MAALLLSLIACFLLTLGARDQLLVANLGADHGQRPAVLLVALGSTFATAAFAAWVGQGLTAMVPLGARPAFAALALLVAGIELAVTRPGKAPEEPTGSLGALALVLAGTQIADSARLLVMALSLAGGWALPAALGGGVGSGLAILAAWLGGAQLRDVDFTGGRRILALIFVLVALWQLLA